MYTYAGIYVLRQRELKLNFLWSQLLVTKNFLKENQHSLLLSIRNNKLDYFTSFLHKHTSTITISHFFYWRKSKSFILRWKPIKRKCIDELERMCISEHFIRRQMFCCVWWRCEKFILQKESFFFEEKKMKISIQNLWKKIVDLITGEKNNSTIWASNESIIKHWKMLFKNKFINHSE